MATNLIVRWPGLDPANRTEWAMYQFPMAPQQYEITEPASTVITPTQEGGKFIESHGSLFKDIRIGGTVGFRPSPVSTEIIPGLANATGVQLNVPGFIQQLRKDERGLDPKEATGFDDIIFLRNIFRAYWDSKQNEETARRLALVWVYAKESEAYIVEPIQFITNRESGRPLSWTYQIQLRTLYPLAYTFTVLDEPSKFWSLGTVSKVLNAVQTINRAMRDLGKLYSQLAGLASYIVRLPFKVMDDIIGGALSVMSSISELQNTMDFSQLPRQKWEKWRSDLRSGYEIMTGVSNNSSIPSDAPPNNLTIFGQEGKNGELAKVIRDMLRIAENLITLDYLRMQSKQVQVKDYSAAYLDEFGEEPLTSGSPLNLSNISLPGSATQEVVGGNENIRSLAKRLLGDEAQWKKLAILNGLKPPYIAASRSPGVLAFGDPILVPKAINDIESQSGVAAVTNPDENSESLSPILRQYGKDIRLVSDLSGLGDVVYGDLSINQQGDIDLISGLDNVYQAVMIKFATEQGELATHPVFGAKYPIGTKFPTLSKFQEYSINTQMTLRQDPRVKDIENIAIRANADQILVDARVSLRGADVQLPISFTVRR